MVRCRTWPAQNTTYRADTDQRTLFQIVGRLTLDRGFALAFGFVRNQIWDVVRLLGRSVDRGLSGRSLVLIVVVGPTLALEVRLDGCSLPGPGFLTASL